MRTFTATLTPNNMNTRQKKMFARNILHPKYHLHIIKQKLKKLYQKAINEHIEHHANRQIIDQLKPKSKSLNK